MGGGWVVGGLLIVHGLYGVITSNMIAIGLLILFLLVGRVSANFSNVNVKHKKDPDVGLNMVELVTKRGYQIETHYVITSDGYILTCFRIPGPAGASPVLLQHGLLDSSYTWISNFADESLGYILADQGFDVWFGNNRGNHYGRNHTTLDPDLPSPNAFWEFTYDEMAKFDAPSMIDYVLSVNGADSLGWVGHSEGTMQFFAGASLRLPAFAKVNLFVGLAPVGSIANIKSPELIALAHTNFANDIIKRGIQEFLPLHSPDNRFDSLVAELYPRIVIGGLDTLCGPTINLNASRIQVYTSETPAGTSTLNMNHFVQGIVDRKEQFKMYDWGSDEANAEHYDGATSPPIYDLSQYNVPSALFSGKRDWMADPKDVKSLIKGIPDKYLVHHTIEEGFAHLDYVWAPAAAKKVYLPAAQLLKQYSASGSSSSIKSVENPHTLWIREHGNLEGCCGCDCHCADCGGACSNAC